MSTDLHVETFGEPTEPVVLLVAGAASSGDWWDARLCEAVAAGGRHVVRYDHRDTGESPTDPPGSPSYPARRLTDDALAVLDAVNADRAHLVGLSAGGGIAQEVALRHPGRVATLTVMSTSAVGGVDDDLPGPTTEVQAAIADPPADPDWSDPGAVVAWWVAAEELAAGGAAVDHDWVRATATRMVHRARDVAASQNHWVVIEGGGPVDDGGGDADDRDVEGRDEPLDVRRITAPTLVVHGALDPFFPPAHGRALARAVPGARLVLFDDHGHQAPPPRVWPRLTALLLEHTRAR